MLVVVDIGGMAVEVDPSHQYSTTSCCHVIDGSRGAVWQMASDMEVHMKQRCVTEFLHVEKIAPINIHWCLLNIYENQTVNMSTVRQLVAVTVTWKISHVADVDAQLSHQKWRASPSADPWESVDYNQGTVYRAEYWLQCFGNDGGNVRISQFIPDGSHQCSHRNRKNIVCKFVRTYWTKTRLKVAIFWSSNTTTRWSQNSSLWSGSMWIPHQRKGSRCSPQWVKWCILSVGIGKGWSFWISWNSDKPSSLTAT